MFGASGAAVGSKFSRKAAPASTHVGSLHGIAMHLIRAVLQASSLQPQLGLLLNMKIIVRDGV
jgi:hypothetical protein